MRRDDLVTRIIGIIVFLGGVGLMAFSFVVAYDWFNDPAAGIQTAAPPGTDASPTAQLGTSALRLFIRLGLLLIMTIIGSLLAGRGAQIYFAASNQGRPAMYPTEE